MKLPEPIEKLRTNVANRHPSDMAGQLTVYCTGENDPQEVAIAFATICAFEGEPEGFNYWKQVAEYFKYFDK